MLVRSAMLEDELNDIAPSCKLYYSIIFNQGLFGLGKTVVLYENSSF